MAAASRSDDRQQALGGAFSVSRTTCTQVGKVNQLVAAAAAVVAAAAAVKCSGTGMDAQGCARASLPGASVGSVRNPDAG